MDDSRSDRFCSVVSGVCAADRNESKTGNEASLELVHRDHVKVALMHGPSRGSKGTLDKDHQQKIDEAVEKAMGILPQDAQGYISRADFIKWYTDNIFDSANAEEEAAQEDEEKDEEPFDSLAWYLTHSHPFA